MLHTGLVLAVTAVAAGLFRSRTDFGREAFSLNTISTFLKAVRQLLRRSAFGLSLIRAL
jgi:hypothetical protein